MATPSCSKCGGKRWVRYFSETTEGDFEEAFGLCPCNRQPHARGEDRRQEPEGARNTTREKLVSRIRAIELRVELW
jgi:hypothetical protein